MLVILYSPAEIHGKKNIAVVIDGNNNTVDHIT